jgi:hypothetical protein
LAKVQLLCVSSTQGGTFLRRVCVIRRRALAGGGAAIKVHSTVPSTEWTSAPTITIDIDHFRLGSQCGFILIGGNGNVDACGGFRHLHRLRRSTCSNSLWLRIRDEL